MALCQGPFLQPASLLRWFPPLPSLPPEAAFSYASTPSLSNCDLSSMHSPRHHLPNIKSLQDAGPHSSLVTQG